MLLPLVRQAGPRHYVLGQGCRGCGLRRRRLLRRRSLLTLLVVAAYTLTQFISGRVPRRYEQQLKPISRSSMQQLVECFDGPYEGNSLAQRLQISIEVSNVTTFRTLPEAKAACITTASCGGITEFGPPDTRWPELTKGGWPTVFSLRQQNFRTPGYELLRPVPPTAACAQWILPRSWVRAGARVGGSACTEGISVDLRPPLEPPPLPPPPLPPPAAAVAPPPIDNEQPETSFLPQWLHTKSPSTGDVGGGGGQHRPILPRHHSAVMLGRRQQQPRASQDDELVAAVAAEPGSSTRDDMGGKERGRRQRWGLILPFHGSNTGGGGDLGGDGDGAQQLSSHQQRLQQRLQLVNATWFSLCRAMRAEWARETIDFHVLAIDDTGDVITGMSSAGQHGAAAATMPASAAAPPPGGKWKSTRTHTRVPNFENPVVQAAWVNDWRERCNYGGAETSGSNLISLRRVEGRHNISENMELGYAWAAQEQFE
eukprot:COSAG05_NODE_61_length_23137_cov_22.080693_16_plen_484_part_00